MFHFLSSYITLCSTRHQINNGPTYPILSQPEQVRAVCRLCVPCSRCLPRIASTLPARVCLFHDVSSPLALSVTPLPLYCPLLALSASLFLRFYSLLFLFDFYLPLFSFSLLQLPFLSNSYSSVSLFHAIFSRRFVSFPFKTTLKFHFSLCRLSNFFHPLPNTLQPFYSAFTTLCLYSCLLFYSHPLLFPCSWVGPRDFLPFVAFHLPAVLLIHPERARHARLDKPAR